MGNKNKGIPRFLDGFKTGTISKNFADTESTSINETIGILSQFQFGTIEQDSLKDFRSDVHEEIPKESLREQSNIFVEKNASTGNDSDLEKENAEQKIPYDVIVKMHFLENRTVRCCGANVFLYEDFGCFEEQNETSLHVAIRKSLPPEMDIKLSKHKIADVVHRIISDPELQVKHDDFDRHTHLINFRNCVFDLRDGRTYPHSPDYLFTSYIDAEYKDPMSRVRIYRNGAYSSDGYYFLKFLKDCTEGDPLKIKSLQELTGYIISNEWRAKKFFVLLGLPHTGKSVWLSLWRSLIGEKHTTAMSLKQLGETRFMTAELFRSKLNITAEMDENGTIKGTDVIKMITGGDLITAEKKGKDPFQFYGKTKLVAACNYMPPLNKLDGTTAFTDRIQFLIFKNTIPEAKRDKSLMDKLVAEKSFIIDWALDGLRELRDRSWIFTESEDARIFKRRYINELNNVTEFVKDRCHVDLFDDDCKVHRKQIYPAYKRFCHDNGFKAISKQEFFVEILKLNVKSGKLRINGSTPLQGFWGIRLKTKNELKKLAEEHQDLTSTLATQD
ncbi:DNA primase [Paenibacillus sp. JMULE4]|uniref:DNA primase family protein n=1 Tax=Paenibacillus sp. JMULE4 TaxID=2518342 RepID=UPI0015773C4E|nr:phage/plasmid primase, P4 family [Paenibacillus sp. JMULE4]NTZ20961.1 DNA primase [Paenibacillus sp. JMULE4]